MKEDDMIKRTVLALSVAAFALTATAFAQENATFTLRSGERLSGQLLDMGGAGFSVRVNGQDRQIPTGEMAVIDFTGAGATQSDWDRLGGGQVIVMKDGQVLNGQLTDVGGSSPLRLSIRANGADRDVSSNDVARIVLSRPNDVPASSAGGPTPLGSTGTANPVGFTVNAQQQWTSTGLTVRRGETLTFSSSGEIKFGPGSASPAGSTETNAGNPVPGPTGALIGRIGNGQPFMIGNQTQITAPAAGELFLGVNDSYVQDNSGSFQVQVGRTGTVTRRR
jgi:hypothetical protein